MAQAASGCTQITSATVISSPGCYQLESGVVDSGAAPYVKIQSSDVILNGMGYTIDGDDQSDNAITVSGAYDNVTVRNVVLTDWDRGVELKDVSKATVANVTVRGAKLGVQSENTPAVTIRDTNASENADHGLVLKDVTGGTVESVTALVNGKSGIYVDKGSANALANTTASDNLVNGAYLKESPNSTLTNITAVNNSEHGLFVDSSNNATVDESDARANGKHGVYVADSAQEAVVQRTVAENNGLNGFRLHHSDGIDARNNTARSNTATGMFLGADSGTVADNTITSNDVGLHLKHHVHTVTGNQIEESTSYGIYLDTDENTLSENLVNASGTAGIFFASGKNNLFYDNYLNNTDNVAFDGGDGESNDWNVTARSETNIVGGSTVAGNFWATPAGDGHSQLWNDSDGDGILDEPHTVASGNVDRRPLVTPDGAFDLDPGTHDYGTIGVSSSATQAITVTSTAAEDIAVEDVRLTGANASSFDITTDPSPTTLATGETTTVDVAFDPATTGTLTAELTVEASDSGAPLETVPLSGTATDQTPPTADAGDNTTVHTDDSVTFNASRSVDNVGVTSYSWDLDDGTTGLTGVTQTHTYQTTGTYNATVTVTDAAGNSDTDAVTIQVKDTTAPLSDAGDDQTVDEDTQISFNGSGSSDDNGITNYTWTFGDGSSATGVTPTHSYPDPGTYTVTLTVEDDAGNTASDELEVTVEDTTAPSVVVGSNRTVSTGTTVSVDGSASTDNVGIASYEWDFGDGSSATGATASRTYQTPGTYTVTLTAKDGADNNATETLTVTVEDVTAPTANAGSDRTITEGGTISVDGSASTDNIGITSYEWDFGDGSTATGATASHTFQSAGTYTVTLTVEDNASNTATDTASVTVETASTDGGGSEGSGGDGGSSMPEPIATETPTESQSEANTTTETNTMTAVSAVDDTTTVVVSNASVTGVVANDSVDIPFDAETPTGENGTDPAVSVSRLEFVPEDDADIELSVLTSDEPLEGTPLFDRTDNTRRVSNIRVNHSISNADVEDVSITFSVAKSRLTASGDDPEDVALYRHQNETWRELPTTRVGETADAVVFRAESPGLSEFAAGVKQPKFELQVDDLTVNEITAGDDVKVQVQITNSGGADGEYVTKLLLNETLVDERRLTIATGGTRQVLFDERLTRRGTYEVRVNNVTAGTVAVTSDTLGPTPTESATPAGLDGTEPTASDTPLTDLPQLRPSSLLSPGIGGLLVFGSLLVVGLLAWRQRTG